MNLPKVITDLVMAQNSFSSNAYADCFTETAVVFDEGKTYKGKKEIQNWIDKANKEYQATMKPLEYSEKDHTLKAEVSGTFPGSPLVLNYHYEFQEGLIELLEIV
ncbi:nuclear transport factor 2 family protein [Flavobacteriaceae bacterium W22]|uniref:nuclear transport factor 2 family protein n=1 Tax=Chryseobacterium binzhouense TaxID=2593646 RepID=UPI0013689A73|nr:nuclear transport factor 2 family protein [Chryseobacterium binzhouense]MXS71516.1 nuclear transport factor 2 family protein [Flavobacteriaceae bacterium W22]